MFVIDALEDKQILGSGKHFLLRFGGSRLGVDWEYVGSRLGVDWE